MDRNTILALCVVALFFGLAWAGVSGQSALVFVGIVIGIAILALLACLLTRKGGCAG